ncbi:MAG: exodeoxyribonuclease V subunit alpha [Oleiphilus sp.]
MMSLAKHPLLKALSGLIEQQKTSLRWIDLYAAQFIAEAFSNPNLALKTSTLQAEKAVKSARTVKRQAVNLDLFDDLSNEPSSEFVVSQIDVFVLALMCSYQINQGKTYLDLTSLPQDVLKTVKRCGFVPGFTSIEQLLSGLKALNQPDFLKCVESPEPLDVWQLPLDEEPASNKSALVLWQKRLYLAKYWLLHQRFEGWLQSRQAQLQQLDEATLAPLSVELKRLFQLDSANIDEINWQAVAAAHTLIKPLCMITGGPGTGKTTTAASLLYLQMYKRKLVNQASENKGLASSNKSLQIRLLAPTGKAAVKLADSIRFQLQQIESRLIEHQEPEERLSNCLPETGETIHRFLYERGGLQDSFSGFKAFRTDSLLQGRQLSEDGVAADLSQQALDIIIVDESSMIDLALMVELISLIPSHTQVILLGDHFQLPAVDPGQVFTDCIHRFAHATDKPEHLGVLSRLTAYPEKYLTQFDTPKPDEASIGYHPLCYLRKTYRFDGDLKTAADQIKAGEFAAFKARFYAESDQAEQRQAVCWFDLAADHQAALKQMTQPYDAYFKLVSERAVLSDLVSVFEQYQLLCSTLEGPLGVHFFNQYIEQRYANWCFPQGKAYGEFYHGKAILVTRNHPHLGIYNGDIGFVVQEANSDNFNVCFPVKNQQAIMVPPARIKQWQTAYAMTVHKSQGSEYEHVGVVLPGYAKELLSRAMLYTALTRSKQRCAVWSERAALEKVFEQDLP